VIGIERSSRLRERDRLSKEIARTLLRWEVVAATRDTGRVRTIASLQNCCKRAMKGGQIRQDDGKSHRGSQSRRPRDPPCEKDSFDDVTTIQAHTSAVPT
jgi:hypothetical protein